MHGPVVRMGGVATGRHVATGRGVALRRAAVMRRGVVVSRGAVMSSRRGRGGRNERWRQLDFGLRLRGTRLIDWRGLLRPKRRHRNHKCGTGQCDTQHDSPPIPYRVRG